MSASKSALETPELSQAELVAALRALPPLDWVRLRKSASIFGRLCQVDPEDLLQRALVRALEGRRKCPRNLALVRFLTEAMRSIASDWAKSRRRRPDLRALHLESSFSDPVEIADEQPNAEERLIEAETKAQLHEFATQMRQELPRLFEDDPKARIIVEGILEGIEGESLRARAGCNRKTFASKRRLIRRRIDKAFPFGGTR